MRSVTAVADDIDTGLFGPHSVTWRVHLEPVLYVGGLRALILQALHPWVMLGTYQNSALFDPAKAFARFVRTAEFVGIRTFGTTSEVEAAAGRVRRIHAKLRGHDPVTGRAFRLDDPQGLLWVHCGEIDSYVDVAAPRRDPERRRRRPLHRGERTCGRGGGGGGRAAVAGRDEGLLRRDPSPPAADRRGDHGHHEPHDRPACPHPWR